MESALYAAYIVSTDEGNDSSKPAQSGIRKFKMFWINKGLMAFENVTQNNFGYTIFNRETIWNQKTIYLELTKDLVDLIQIEKK